MRDSLKGRVMCPVPIIILMSITFAIADPPDATVPPTTRVVSCTIGDCHGAQTRYRYLHGPVAADFCKACHDYDDAKNHTFLFKQTGAAMCEFCHIGKSDTAGLTVHEPVEEGKCISCHNPHGSSRKLLLSAPTTREVCSGCHEDVLAGRKEIHKPIADGDCLTCHKAHSSIHPGLLRQEKRQLCLSCHPAIVSPRVELPPFPPTLESNHDLRLSAVPSQTVHEPMSEDCSTCHENHASNHASLLRETTRELCLSCHEPIKELMTSGIQAHDDLNGDRSCLNCHLPHSSKADHLLRDEEVEVCLGCHAEEIVLDSDRIIASVSEIADPDVTLHGPLAEGTCKGCHNPHGTAFPHQLVASMPDEFFRQFEPEAFGLCFSCHDPSLVNSVETDQATNFRNGTRNLHALHILEQGEKGRNCRVCHTAHASHGPGMIHRSSPFGQWEIPLGYEQTETGGGCAAGCHRAFYYDRVTPVQNRPPENTETSAS